MPDFDSANVLVGLGKISVDGTSLGYTSGGVVIALTTDRVDKEVDQSFSPIGILKVRESYEIRTSLAEATLENLKIVWEQTATIVAGGAAVGEIPNRTLDWGVNQGIVEHTLEFLGNSPEGFVRRFNVNRAVVFAVGETNHVRDGITLIPVTFRILPDVSLAIDKQYGSIEDETTDIPNP